MNAMIAGYLLWPYCTLVARSISYSHIVESYQGENHIFSCSKDSFGKDCDAKWIFSSSSAVLRDQVSLSNDKNVHIEELQGQSTLSIRNTSKANDGTYWCITMSEKGKHHTAKEYRLICCSSISDVEPRYLIEKRDKCLAFVILLALTVFLGVVAFALFNVNRRNQKQITAKTCLYISHCSLSKEQKRQLLKFSSWLESQISGLSVVLDLTKKGEINKVGGLAKWIPQQMTKVNKVLVVWSEEYVNAFKGASSDVEASMITSDTLKVLAEYRNIERLQNNNCQMKNDIIICWQSGNLESLPPIFQGKSFYLLPQFTKSGILKDNAFLNIISAVQS